MYVMMPIAYLSAEEYAQFREAYLRVLLPFWATVVAVALAIALLAVASAGWLRMIEWCRVELNPISCSLYLAGI